MTSNLKNGSMENIDKEIKKTLDSVNDWNTLETDSFFINRVMNRIDKQGEESKKKSNPSLIVTATTIAAMFFISISGLGYYMLSGSNQPQNDTDELLVWIDGEYGVSNFIAESDYYIGE